MDVWIWSLAGAVLLGLASIVLARLRRASSLLRFAALAALMQIPGGCVAGRGFFWWDLRRAKSFAESFVPEIERARTITGNYPESIESLIRRRDPESIPRMLRLRSAEPDDQRIFSGFYSVEGVEFEFSLADPGICGQWYVWMSDRRKWEEYYHLCLF
jgi:hypothetical protein